MPYTDQLELITLPSLRAQCRSPSTFRTATAVRLTRTSFPPTDLSLVRVNSPTSFGGQRVFLKCPRADCGQLVNVIGFEPVAGFGCKRCLRWRRRPACRDSTLVKASLEAETLKSGRHDSPELLRELRLRIRL